MRMIWTFVNFCVLHVSRDACVHTNKLIASIAWATLSAAQSDVGMKQSILWQKFWIRTNSSETKTNFSSFEILQESIMY